MKVHRGRATAKLDVQSVADLVRLVDGDLVCGTQRQRGTKVPYTAVLRPAKIGAALGRPPFNE